MFCNKIKPLIFILILSIILSFLFCIFYPVKETSLLFCKSFFLKKDILINSDNIRYYNYERTGNKFSIIDTEHILFVENINLFIKDIKIKLKKPLDKDIPLQVFIQDFGSKNPIKVLDIKNSDNYLFTIKIEKKIRDIFMIVGNEVGDSFLFDNISYCIDKSYPLNIIKNYNYFSEIKNIKFRIRFLLIFLLLFFIQIHFIFNIDKLYEWFYKNRYYIACTIILFVIIFELNNSSIDLWNSINHNDPQHSGVIFGKARDCRADEYGVYTPMLLSQSPKYPYFNKVLRGTKTDISTVYGQPIKNIITLFRPFLLGFLFLGSTKGLSFFWIIRLVCLFLVTFEFLLLITRKNKKLSLIGTLLITFAPAVQWWWTPNGIAEIIIYGELLIILLNNYFIQKNYIKRMLELFVIMVLLGSFILVLYPAWQVPIFYIFMIIGIWCFIENYKNYKFYRKDTIPIIIFLLIFLSILIYIYILSKESIYAITHTVYPGLRFETGGDKYTEISICNNYFMHIFRYWGNIFFTLTDNKLQTNPCNFAVFLDLFPIGIIIAFVVLFKEKIRDKLLIMFLCLYLFFSIWCSIGFPKFLAQITMLKVSPVYRLFIVLGFLNILILIRAMSLNKYIINKIVATIMSLIFVLISVICNFYIYERYLDIYKILTISVLSFFIYYYLLRNKINKLFILIIAIIMFFSGGLVNPIQKGTDVIENMQILNVVQQINTNKPGLWLVESFEFPIPNLLIVKGIPTINSTNIYPNMEMFNILDKEKKYENIYNRYCHINVKLVENNNDVEKFVNVNNFDAILINMTPKDVINLNIDYIFTNSSDLSKFNNENIEFVKLCYFNKVFIYYVNKKTINK